MLALVPSKFKETVFTKIKRRQVLDHFFPNRWSLAPNRGYFEVHRSLCGLWFCSGWPPSFIIGLQRPCLFPGNFGTSKFNLSVLLMSSSGNTDFWTVIFFFNVTEWTIPRTVRKKRWQYYQMTSLIKQTNWTLKCQNY